MLPLGIRKIEAFVRNQQELGNDVRWDNYTVVFFRPHPNGIYSKDGAIRNGVWGYENRVEVNSKGIWEIDSRNIKRDRTVRGTTKHS
jgi:hypothetical protein